MEINEDNKIEKFNSELLELLEKENIPVVPRKLKLLKVQQLPDLSKWRRH